MSAMKKLLRFLVMSFCITQYKCLGKILRNNALMNKMVSDFQKDNNLSDGPTQSHQPEGVMTLMQNVLCRNFPTIPCEIITADTTLKKLIEKSIQQLNYKKLALEQTTIAPGYSLTLFPAINSEDLSNFLQVHPIGHNKEIEEPKKYDNEITTNTKQRKKAAQKTKKHWPNKKLSRKKKNKKESKRTAVYNGRKKIRKFYPHKIKYKRTGKEFGNSDENLSLSVESPDTIKKQQLLSFNKLDSDDAVWRIDYTKHGEPSLSRYGRESDQLQTKLIKTGPSVIVDDNVLEQAARRDVLHPDIYIKKNIRRHSTDYASDGVD